MPQTLYRFGFHSNQPTAVSNAPTPVLTIDEIDILWASWCDLIYTTRNSTSNRSIAYIGTSLTPAQIESFADPKSNIIRSVQNPQCRLSFFGNAMHNGVQGYLTGTEHPSDSTWDKECDNVVAIFNTETEKESSTLHLDSESWVVPLTHHSLLNTVTVCSDDSLLLAFKVRVGEDNHEPKLEGTGHIRAVQKMRELRDYCTRRVNGEWLAGFRPVQLVVNATTATALDENGRVYTRTVDPRYPACLGRPHIGTSIFEPVPYLSETRITKIASGGYMTAAISEDGEMFLWGQANPGTEGELGILHRLDYSPEVALTKKTAVWGDTEQDEYVKCLNIHIDGKDAIACDVAIGCGHILVAAKDAKGQHVVLVAGCGAEGQLGLGKAVDFLEEFEEIVALRDKQVMQLAGAGWSSFVIIKE